jgi:anti-sigma-K factor RskA
MNTPNPSPGSEIDALLAGQALGDLDDAERQRLASLLQTNPALRGRLQEFQTTLELLPLALPVAEAPPPGLRRRLLEQPPLRSRSRSTGWLVPAALAIALVGLGLELRQTNQQLAQIQTQLQARSEASPAEAPGVSRRLSLEAAKTGLQANGEVMVTGNPTHNVLMLNDLPPPPPHHVYRLWATVGGEKVGCVSFVPTEQGHVAMLIPPMPTSLATSVSVSVEADPLGTSPTGPLVLTSKL